MIIKAEDFLRFLQAARDPLRRFAWSRFKKLRTFFTISAVRARPSAEIRVVEVQTTEDFFYDFCGARATLCGDSRGRGSITEDFFYDFCKPRATLCGDSRGRGSITEDFLRFLQAARNPLRRFAWSRFKQLRTSSDFCKPRATLCGDSRGRGSITEDFLRFLQAERDPLRRFAWSRFKN